MAKEDGQSLQKRPELVPEKLMEGGLIVGVEPGIQGSLMSVTGAALERITREREGVPPEYRLPENAVYFMDPDSKRLVMISRRDGDPEWKSGLFAETVELDDEGKPRFRLSTKEVTIPRNQYQMVAVGPNRYGMPPSHIDMVEDTSGKEKFVPWNLYLADLQSWMNQVKLDPEEDFETFMKKFDELRDMSRKEISDKVRTEFIGGPQGFNKTVAPFNLIITDDLNRDMCEKASRDAGLFPVFVSVKDFIIVSIKQKKIPLAIDLIKRNIDVSGNWNYYIGHFLPADWESKARTYSPAVITHDYNAVWRLEEDKEFVEETMWLPSVIHSMTMPYILKSNPIFTYVTFAKREDGDPSKQGNGNYYCPNNEQAYKEFLYKIKADLLLTMFLRGGAPIVK